MSLVVFLKLYSFFSYSLISIAISSINQNKQAKIKSIPTNGIYTSISHCNFSLIFHFVSPKFASAIEYKKKRRFIMKRSNQKINLKYRKKKLLAEIFWWNNWLNWILFCLPRSLFLFYIFCEWQKHNIIKQTGPKHDMYARSIVHSIKTKKKYFYNNNNKF